MYIWGFNLSLMSEVLGENNLKALVSLLNDEDREVLEHVNDKILSIGGTIMIPLLENEWENNYNPSVQKRIEVLIHTLQFETLKHRLQTWHKGGGEDMLEGLWLVATYLYPDLSLEKMKADFEQLFYEAWLEMQNDIPAIDQVKILNNVLFSKMKFTANSKNFHSPSNSMINVVLESRKGNPISLCMIYMLVAQKLKMPVLGVNLPNLFILTYKSAETQFYINAFNKGLIFSKSDIDNYIAHLNLTPNDIFYEPCTHLDILRRVFRNLIVSFEKNGESEKVLEIKALLQVISDNQDVGYV